MSENEIKPQFAMQRVYLKDASLETPAGPQVFTKAWKPEVKLDLNTRTLALDETHYEVVLTVTATVNNEDAPSLLVEIHQAGIFMISGLSQDDLEHTLGAFCPNILFPYAREAVDNFITRASFPPLMLAPVNFDALYAQQKQRQQEEAQAQPTEASH